jgi:hypothetical protein
MLNLATGLEACCSGEDDGNTWLIRNAMSKADSYTRCASIQLQLVRCPAIRLTRMIYALESHVVRLSFAQKQTNRDSKIGKTMATILLLQMPRISCGVFGKLFMASKVCIILGL